MSRNGIPAAQIRAWTAPGLANSKIRRDVLKYATAALDRSELVGNTEALQHFTGDALVLWSTASAVMSREHGRRLARQTLDPPPPAQAKQLSVTQALLAPDLALTSSSVGCSGCARRLPIADSVQRFVPGSRWIYA